MFRLSATLVTTTVSRPWRTGWSLERGVDFLLPRVTPAKIGPASARTERPAAEPACFIDEDWAVPPDSTGVKRVRATATEAASDAEAAGLQVWWSLSGKSSGT